MFTLTVANYFGAWQKQARAHTAQFTSLHSRTWIHALHRGCDRKITRGNVNVLREDSATNSKAGTLDPVFKKKEQKDVTHAVLFLLLPLQIKDLLLVIFSVSL